MYLFNGLARALPVDLDAVAPAVGDAARRVEVVELALVADKWGQH